MRSWDEIVEDIAIEEGVTKAEADAIYRKRIAAASGEMAEMREVAAPNRAARRAAARRAR